MKKPLVSIMMPAYNAGKYIRRAIESVLVQTYENWELIIVDDCSTDNTYEIAASYKDRRIRIFRNDVNIGPGPSRNEAIKNSRGEWLAYLDADDIWLPERLEKILSVVQNLDDEKYFVTDILTRGFDRDGQLIPWKKDNLINKVDKNVVNVWTFEEYLSNGHPIIAPVFPHSFITRRNIEFESLRFAEDLDFWIKLFANGLQLLIIPDSFYIYRLTPNSRTTSADFADLCHIYDKWLKSDLLNEAEKVLIKQLRRKAEEQKTYQPFANRLKQHDVLGAISVAMSNPTVLITFLKGIPSMVSYRLSALKNGVSPR